MITRKLELSGNSAPDSHRDSFLLIVLTKKKIQTSVSLSAGIESKKASNYR